MLKQELELLVSCLRNHSANLQLKSYNDQLVILKNINGHCAGEIYKKFHQQQKENGLSLGIVKTVEFLDITLDLNTGIYKPYHKPNVETLYISSHFEIFNEASKHYQNIIN